MKLNEVRSVQLCIFFTTPGGLSTLSSLSRCYPRSRIRCELLQCGQKYFGLPSYHIQFQNVRDPLQCRIQESLYPTREPSDLRKCCSLYKLEGKIKQLCGPTNPETGKDCAEMVTTPPNAAVMQSRAEKTRIYAYRSLARSIGSGRWNGLTSAGRNLHARLDVSVDVHQSPLVFPFLALLVVADFPWLVECREPIIGLA